MRRSLAAILALLNVANGLWMLFAGPAWYATVPGVTHTGRSTRTSCRTSAPRSWSQGLASQHGHGSRPFGRRE